MELTIAQQNLRHGGWGSLDPAQPAGADFDRLDQLTTRLAPVSADILVLNEIWKRDPDATGPSDPATRGADTDRIHALADALGMRLAGTTPSHSDVPTAVLWRPAALGAAPTWDVKHQHMFGHGAGVAAFTIDGIAEPIAVGAIHVSPWSWTGAMTELHTLACRIHEHHRWGIIAGDINFPPLCGPAADTAGMKAHNAMNRLHDPWDPESPPQRGPATELFKARYLDTAILRFLASVTAGAPEPGLLARTGKTDRIDQILVCADLAAAVTGYQRLDEPAYASDHFGIAATIDLDRLPANERTEHDAASVIGRYRDYVRAVLDGADPHPVVDVNHPAVRPTGTGAA